MSTKLDTRAREREALLDRIVELLKSDRRVVAAWLGGSLGAERADALSDIDVNVVLSLPYFRFVSNATRDFVARIPGLLVCETDDANAPENGAYLLTMYHGETGPHQVDWYWLTDSIRAFPNSIHLLFNHTDIPLEHMQFPGMSEFDTANEVARFWALAAIAAKKVARNHHWSAIAMLSKIQHMLDLISWQLGKSAIEPVPVDRRSTKPPTEGASQIEELRRLIDGMVALSPDLVSLGLEPSERMAEELAPLLDLANSLSAGPG